MSGEQGARSGDSDATLRELREKIANADMQFRDHLLRSTAWNGGGRCRRTGRWVKRQLAGEWKYWRLWPFWKLDESAIDDRNWHRIQIGLRFKEDGIWRSIRRIAIDPLIISILVIVTGLSVALYSRHTCVDAPSVETAAAGSEDAVDASVRIKEAEVTENGAGLGAPAPNKEAEVAESGAGVGAPAPDREAEVAESGAVVGAPAPDMEAEAAACKNNELFNTKSAQFLLILLGFFAAAWRWKVGQQHVGVEDAMRRKDRTNNYIAEQAKKISEFVDTSFHELPNAKEIDERDKAVVRQLFVYQELDTLEFVYDKAKQDLVGEGYVPRALKIFGVRAQDYEFRKLAENLIEIGRYNPDFKRAVRLLLKASEEVAPQRAAASED